MKKIHILCVALLMTLSAAFISTESHAQVKSFTTTGLSTGVDSVTVVNTATAYLQVQKTGWGHETTIAVIVRKNSGTVAGTITLQGSLDGTNFKALTTAETQTALATITAADASGSYAWRLNNNPFPYYRVSWTGAGTMSASLHAKILSH